MSAFFVATVSIKHPEKMKEYAEKSTATFAPFRAEIVAKGALDATLCGDDAKPMVAIVKFEDIHTLNQWYQSPAYQALIPLRDSAADVSIASYVMPQA